MKVLVACEFSGTVRDAFTAAGHYAMSCDILPSETPGEHYQGDIREVLDGGVTWDLMVAHPPCTFLTNSGVRWLHDPRPKFANRWNELDDAAAFFRMFLEAPIPRIAVENPVMHRYGVERIGQRHSQTIQPYEYGHGETKRTALWLKNLPLLESTELVEGREARVHRNATGTGTAERAEPVFSQASPLPWLISGVRCEWR